MHELCVFCVQMHFAGMMQYDGELSLLDTTNAVQQARQSLVQPNFLKNVWMNITMNNPQILSTFQHSPMHIFITANARGTLRHFKQAWQTCV